ncbi:Short chain fatty acids transporter [Rhodovulum sp. PH10]|uniref:short-chain fatty acid transporter n=1 Tax=Rhodovulum sp. PH10 TaxID=1187851 RepID=UPI00027C2664|nr:TIGR00366 family protein [Rhodovulum sp. PH10]EJW11758.1 Short chain fatty acids transporter [Rhodovulum sp. PH10]
MSVDATTTDLGLAAAPSVRQGGLARLAYAFTAWAEKWYPDAFVFVIFAVLVVAAANLATGASPVSIAQHFGDGFWTLIPFTMQMAMVLITGYVLAVSPPVAKLIDLLAAVPRSNAAAIAWVAFVSMMASYVNYALSLVLGGLLIRALARRTELGMDYRAAGAAAYLGLGATWALGLSSSAAMLQANAGSLPKAISDITGVIPLSQTIFLWNSIVAAIAIMVLSVAVSFLSAPKGSHVRTAQDMGCDVSLEQVTDARPTRPGEWAEFTPILPVLVVIIAAAWIGMQFWNKPALQVIGNLNTYNFILLMVGLLLHKNIYSFHKAVVKSVPTTGGVLLQFPFYGAVAAMMTAVPGSDGLTLSHHISDMFVSIANTETYPVVIGIYSAVLGFFVPSGGGKWIIEAPYVMQAAKDLHTHLGWAVTTYNAAEALPNLINPFWMLPLLGVLGLKARDIVGFCFTQFLFHVPLVLFLLWFLAPHAG